MEEERQSERKKKEGQRVWIYKRKSVNSSTVAIIIIIVVITIIIIIIIPYRHHHLYYQTLGPVQRAPRPYRQNITQTHRIQEKAVLSTVNKLVRASAHGWLLIPYLWPVTGIRCVVEVLR